MRTLFLAACCIACFVGPGLAQDVDAALRGAMAAWATAIAAGDAEPIARYALDDDVFISPSGVALARQARLDQISKAKPRRDTLPQSDHRYQTLGDTVVHTYRQDGMNPQGQIVPTRQLQVWVKQNGTWRVAAS